MKTTEKVLTIVLKPIGQTPNSTVSVMYVPSDDNKFLGFVIEDGHRDKKEAGKTRIPAGIYEIKKRFAGRHYDSYTGRFEHKHTFQVMDVPNFSWIMIHVGNTVKDTEGCLLLNNGVTLDMKTQNFKGFSSISCYKAFYNYITPIIENCRIFIEVIRLKEVKG